MKFLLQLRILTTVKIYQSFLCALLVFFNLNSAEFFSLAVAASTGGKPLVQKGIDQYNTGQLDRALDTLRQAEASFPESIAIPYYKGLIYLKRGEREMAISHWRRYVAMAPQDEETQALRQRVTLLLHTAAKEYAKKAVAEESGMLNRPVDEDTVAVTAFKNLGSDSLAPLGKGMAAMIIADLSLFEDLKVVEREKLAALLAEMRLGGSGLVNEKSAPKVGKLLRARYVTSGSLANSQAESLQIASILFDAERGASAGGQNISGELAKFYELEKVIACGIVSDLGRNCNLAPKDFKKIHTRSLAALEAYSYGLDYLDQEKYDEARNMFQKAVAEDPQFELARMALWATPAAAMLLLTEAQIISSASASAPPAAATSATAAVSTGAGGVSIGTTAAVTGGVVVAGGAVAAVVSRDDSGNDSPSPQVDLNGQWRGVWSDPSGNSGEFVLQLSQDGDTLTGETSITETDCITTASVSGQCSNDQLSLNINSTAAGATLSAQTASNSEMEGSLAFTSGACAGSAIQVSAQKTGGAVVEW